MQYVKRITCYFLQVFSGRIPRALYVFLLKNTQIPGSYTTNPFSFHHYNFASAQIQVDIIIFLLTLAPLMTSCEVLINKSSLSPN